MGNQSKAIGGALSGALSVLVVWGLTAGAGIEVPVAVDGAIATVIGYIVVYFMPANTDA